MSIKQTSLYTYSGYKKHNTSRIFYVKTNKTAINFKPFPPLICPTIWTIQLKNKHNLLGKK